jgi:hypothetical protein|tara:strand:+ start:776 stop:2164 length:1389 start_codon:yes stop_codon:yes gene_type:complete
MALNPFFQQGTSNEQDLVQDLVNEQIKMYGVEFVYMPRIFVNVKTIMREVASSKFTKSFPIEGYIESYEGFDAGYNLLTKFGVRTNAEMKIVISQDRYLNYIAPLMDGHRGLTNAPTRPYEGDLLYFPYRDLLMEIKYVDDVSNFYQLRKNYTYTLTTEPFEYEDEVIQTGVINIDDDFKTAGYNATFELKDIGTTADVVTTRATGVRYIKILNGGSGWTAAPTIKISPPVGGGTTATAVAITTSTGTSQLRSTRISEIYITNPGTGYTMTPTVQFISEDGKGSGAKVDVAISTTSGIGPITINNVGADYVLPPEIVIANPPSGGHVAKAHAVIDVFGRVREVRITDAGVGYSTTPTITVGAAGTIGIGTFSYGEIIKGQTSLSTAFVTSWDAPTLTLKARNLSGDFQVGELIVDNEGSAYRLNTVDYDDDDFAPDYNSGDTIQSEADSILDFTEKNPFGEV